MSLRLQMLQVARLGPKLLGDSAELVQSFLLRQQNPDGGFKDRIGKSDLYYTVFGLEGLSVFIAQSTSSIVTEPQKANSIDRAEAFLRSFGSGEGLDFVHLCSLVRSWAAVVTLESQNTGLSEVRHSILARLENYRSRNGGYNAIPNADAGTAYGAFLALGAYQDLNAEPPDHLRLVQSLKFLETPEGGWTNELSPRPSSLALRPSTNATAAAVSVLRALDMPINPAVADWLLAQAHPQGGFLAAPGTPLPDLLSTATALHALAGMQSSFDHLKEPCLDFIDSLWTNEGGFFGHWGDDHLDCEYTYYGLLALGHLSL